MNKTTRIIIGMAVVAVAALAFVAKERGKPSAVSAETLTTVATTAAAPGTTTSPVPAKLPKLIDLGADKCIPCKMMAPILAEFKRDYADQFVTEFIDVWKNPDPGKQYGIRAIPTQIFLDSDGKELFRHEGFYGREDMLNKWKELGVEIRTPSAAAN
jgi:thioredoxin 1